MLYSLFSVAVFDNITLLHHTCRLHVCILSIFSSLYYIMFQRISTDIEARTLRPDGNRLGCVHITLCTRSTWYIYDTSIYY